MTVKIYKKWEHPIFGWLPYLVIHTSNISKEEYAKMHAESDSANYRYDIIKEEDD